MKYLIDTNILIYYFNGSLSVSAKEIITAMLNDDFNISVISKMEFLGFQFRIPGTPYLIAVL